MPLHVRLIVWNTEDAGDNAKFNRLTCPRDGTLACREGWGGT